MGKLNNSLKITNAAEHKLAEEELRRSEEKYRLLISNLPDVAWTSDENYRLRTCLV